MRVRDGGRGKAWSAWLVAGLLVASALSSCSGGDADPASADGASGQAGEPTAPTSGGTHVGAAGSLSSGAGDAGAPSGGAATAQAGTGTGPEGGRADSSMAGGGASGGGAGNELGFGGAISLSPGECFVDGECAATQSGTCTGGDAAKICEHRHDACRSHDDCGDGEYCDGYCKPAAAKSQPCSTGNRCAEGLACQAGVCVNGSVECSAPYYDGPKLVVPVNTSCPSGSACLDSSYHRCDAAVNIGPPDCGCRKVGGLHQLCPLDGLQDAGTYAARQIGGCDAGLTCAHEDMEYSRGYCEPRSGMSELCGETAGSVYSGLKSDSVCLEGLYCGLTVQDLTDIAPNLPENRCVPAPAGGKACSVSIPCDSGYVCRQTSWRCLPSPKEGEPCLDKALCASDQDCSRCATGLECRSGTCERLAAYGRSCDARGCAPELNCVEARVGGSCDTAP